MTPPKLFSQATVPEWRLSDRPRFEVGRTGVDLYRVRAASPLSNGGFVVADGGNRRILVFSPTGELLRELGGKGSGPGEFTILWDLTVVRDTIIAYDSALRRASLWTSAGMWIGTNPLPAIYGRPVDLLAALGPTEYVVGTRPIPAGNRSGGLLRDMATIFLVRGSDAVPRELGRREWKYTYVYHHDDEAATTGYSVPFLGETLLLAIRGRVVVVPLDSATVEISTPGGARVQRVTLPIPRRPFDPSVIEAHRDSALADLRRDPRFNGRGFGERIQDVFGSDFPMPEYAPRVEAAREVGDAVWLKSFPDTPEATTVSWYVVDPTRARLVGRLLLDRRWDILGGDGERVLVLRRDEFDVEYIAVYDVLRSN